MAMSDWLSSLRLRMGSSWQSPPKRRRRWLHCSVPAIVEALETRTLLSAVAVDDAFAIDNTGAAVELDVLANDWSDIGAPLHIVSVGSASHGSATVVYGDGSGSGSGSGSGGDPTIQDQLRYTPLSGFYGTDTLTYTVSDGFGNSQTATLTIQVSDPSGGGSGSGSGSAGGTASASGSGSGSASGSGSGSAGGSSSGTGGTSGSGSGSSGTSGSGSGSSSGTGSGSTTGSGAAAVYTLKDGFVVDPLATFIWTGGDVNTTDQTTETASETWTDEAGVAYTAVTTTTSTLTIVATVGADGNWTYDETLVSSYTTETTAAGVTGSITATGTFDYAFPAFSTSAVYSFTFNADGEDDLSGNLTDTWSEIESGVLEEGTSTLVWVAAAQFAVVIQSTTQRSDGSIAGRSSGSGTASSSSSSTLDVTRTSGAGSSSSSGSASSSGSGSASSSSSGGTTPGWTFTHSSQGTGSSNETWSYSTTASKSADGTISASGSASGSVYYAADETFTESYDEEKTDGTVSLDSTGTSHVSGSDSYLTTFSTVTTVDAAGVETTTGTLRDEVSGTSLVTFSGADTYSETWQTMTGVVMIDNGDGTFTVDLSNATITNKQVGGTSSTNLSSTASYSTVSLLTLDADGSAVDELTGSESGTATFTVRDEFTETETITAPNKTTNRAAGGTADSTATDTFLSSVALVTTIAADETVTVTGTTAF